MKDLRICSFCGKPTNNYRRGIAPAHKVAGKPINSVCCRDCHDEQISSILSQADSLRAATVSS